MDYKKYALENLTNWLHDCVSCEHMSSQEIYDTIKEVIEDNYKVYNNIATKCKDLMDMIPAHFKYEMSMENDLIKIEKSTNMSSSRYEEFLDPKGNYVKTNQYSDIIFEHDQYNDIIFFDNSIKPFSYPGKKWTVNIEKDSTNDEYFFTLPEELIETLSWEEGDEVEYIDNRDGTFLIKKVEKTVEEPSA